LLLTGLQGQAEEMLRVDGTSGTGWVGAANVGMVELQTDGTLAAVNTSMLLIDFDGTYAANTLGGCLYIDDNGTAAGTDYSMYINSNAVNCMLLRTVAAAMSGLVVDGPASQTAPMVLVDGSVGSWIGAGNSGMLQLDNDGSYANVTDSMLLITNTGIPVNDSRGHCLRIVDTGNAAGGTDAFAVYISSTDAECEAIFVDDGDVLLDDNLILNRPGAGAGFGQITLGAAGHAGGENVITIENGAAKPGALGNTSSLYTEAGELEGMDAGGAETTLTPHSIEGDYMINSYDPSKGYTFRVHLEMLIDWLVEKFPEIASYVEHIEGRAEKRPRASKSPKKVKVT